MKKTKLLVIVPLILSVVFYGCKPDGNTGSNGSTEPSVENTAADVPSFSPAGGFYTAAQTVELTSDNSVAIYYTTDLSKPTTSSTKYTEPFTVSTQCIVRAMAVGSDGVSHYAMTCYDFDNDRSTDYSGTTLASPEWKDQVIYFLMTDRFMDGDSTNNRQNIVKADGTAYDETVPLSGQPVSGYNGGDFKGVEEKLDYIKGLGCTAIWITPPIRNQVSEGSYHGFHGYWASDFTRTDPHFGTLAEYQALVDAAHQKGLYVIQDIVVNHTGDYMQGTGGVTTAMVETNTINSNSFYLNSYSVGLNDSSEWTHPEQLPWKFNDPHNFTAEEFENNRFYNYNPAITNFNLLAQRYTWQSSGLDDICTSNPVVRNLLRGYFRYWIRKCNIDGYRIDTVYYVEPSFFEDFINDTDTGNEGVREYAKKLGKNDFLDFGEAWTTDEKITTQYSSSGTKRIDSVIYFPLTFALRDIASGGSTQQLADVLNNRYTAGYQDPDRLVTFVDNHDLERLLSKADPELVKAVYTFIMSVPGIPQIYYGTEQGFTVTRRAMFKGGYMNDGTTNTSDCFDTTGSWYAFVQNLTKLRADNDVLRYNRVTVLKSSTDSGIFAMAMQGKSKTDATVNTTGAGCRAFYVLNTTGNALTCHIPANKTLVAGDVFTLNSISSDSCEKTFTVKSDGVADIIIPSKTYALYILSTEGTGASSSVTNTISIDTIPDEEKTTSLTISATTTCSGTVYAVFNDDFSNKQTIGEKAAGTFTSTLDLSVLAPGTNTLVLIQDTDGAGNYIYSVDKTFTFNRPYVSAGSWDDPKDDDHGPDGCNYTQSIYFEGTDHANRKSRLDITKVTTYTSGGNLKIEVELPIMEQSWNPTTNKFDHVMFSIFLADPNSTSGCAVQPLHRYTLPNGFKWDYCYKPYGFGVSCFSSKGATADVNGAAVTPIPTSSVDWSPNTTAATKEPGKMTFFIKGATIGNPKSLKRWKLYINTWDMDFDKLRALQKESVLGTYVYPFGSSENPQTDPLVMDETTVMTLNPEE